MKCPHCGNTLLYVELSVRDVILPADVVALLIADKFVDPDFDGLVDRISGYTEVELPTGAEVELTDIDLTAVRWEWEGIDLPGYKPTGKPVIEIVK